MAVSAAVVSAYGVPMNDSTSSARPVRCSSGANGSRPRGSVTSRNTLTMASRSSGSPERNAARRLWNNCCSCAPCGGRTGSEVECRRCGWLPRPCFFFGTARPYETKPSRDTDGKDHHCPRGQSLHTHFRYTPAAASCAHRGSLAARPWRRRSSSFNSSQAPGSSSRGQPAPATTSTSARQGHDTKPIQLEQVCEIDQVIGPTTSREPGPLRSLRPGGPRHTCRSVHAVTSGMCRRTGGRRPRR